MVVFKIPIVTMYISNALIVAGMYSSRKVNSNVSHQTNDLYGKNGSVDYSKIFLEKLLDYFERPVGNCTWNEKNSKFKKLCIIHEYKKKSLVSKHCDRFLNVIIGVSNIISSTLALIGNTFVIWVLFRQHYEFTRFNHLIIGLSISDFMFAFLQLIKSIPQTWTCQWIYGLFLCKFLFASLTASSNIAIGLIVLISIERYNGVVHFLSPVLNKSRFQTMNCLNIFFGILSVTPLLKVLKTEQFSNCSEEWSRESSRVYTWILFLCYFFLPIILITVLYTITVLRLQKTMIKSNGLSIAAKKSRFKKNKKVLLILVLILVMFAILTLPNRIFWIISDVHDTYILSSSSTIRLVTMLSEIPYGFHAAVNPIIYSIVDSRFRKQFKSLIKTVANTFT